MTDIKQLLPTTIYQAAIDPSSLRSVANAANPFATLADITGAGLSTADNGLTATLGNVQLGGALIQNTTIDGAFVLELGTALSPLVDLTGVASTTVSFTAPTINLFGTDEIYLYTQNGAGNYVFIDSLLTPTTAALYTSAFEATSGNATNFDLFSDGTTSTINAYSTFAGFAGIEYGADYSANYSLRSLVDKDYVDSQITAIAPTLAQVLANGNLTNELDITSNNGFSSLLVRNAFNQMNFLNGSVSSFLDMTPTQTSLTFLDNVSTNYADIILKSSELTIVHSLVVDIKAEDTINEWAKLRLESNGVFGPYALLRTQDSTGAVYSQVEFGLPGILTIDSTSYTEILSPIVNIPSVGVNKIVYTALGGTLTAVTIGAGISFAAGTLSATGVSSVSGTLNRITSTGGTTPVIDIAATYVGQTSITTLGTVTTGTWNGTVIGATFGGTGQSVYAVGDTLYANTTTTLAKLTAGTTGQVLTIAGGVPTWATPAASTTFPYRAVTANDLATSTDYTLDATSGTFTQSFPTAIGIQGKIYVVKNSGGGSVILAGALGQTFDGVASPVILSGNSVTIQSNNANWIIIG